MRTGLVVAGLMASGTAAARAATLSVEAAGFTPDSFGNPQTTSGYMFINGSDPGATSTGGNVIKSQAGPTGTAYGADSLVLIAQGVPASPALASTVVANALAGTTINILVTEQGLTAAQASIPMQVDFTLNARASSASGQATFADYVSRSDAQFDTSSADLLHGATLTNIVTGDHTTPTASGLGINGTYSVTEFISIVFATAGSLSVSSALTPQPTPTPVPEPAGTALLGAGALGILAAVRRRRRDVGTA